MDAWVKNLNVETYGPEDGEPVLLLHGWGSNAGLMRPLAFALQDAYRVYNIDLPGHGQSPVPPEPWGIPEHAQLVEAFINQVIGQAPHFVGHSNGGRISLYMASDPDLQKHIQSLSLISPSGVKPRRTMKYHFKKTLASSLKAPFRLFPSKLRNYGLDWLRHTLIWRMLGSSDYSQLKGVMREVFVKTVNCLLDDRLNLIDKPTLLFWGTEDTAISRHQMDVLLHQIKGSELVPLEGAGHYGHLDQPAIVTGGLRHFLDHLTTRKTTANKTTATT